jgi:hypothetical protein
MDLPVLIMVCLVVFIIASFLGMPLASFSVNDLGMFYQPLIKLKAVRLIPNHPENAGYYLSTQGLSLTSHYAVLGEWADTGHYLILDVKTGTILPGIFHLDRFEEIQEDDL